jgi:hypothetical protein
MKTRAMQFTRTNAAVAAIAIILALVVVVALTVQPKAPVLTNSTSQDGVTLTGFAPYNESGVQTAYELGILESGVSVGQVAVAAESVSGSNAPVSMAFSFMSNTSFNFEIDCVTFLISQVNSRPNVSSPVPTVEGYPTVHWVENDTTSARVFSFCSAQLVNKEGWVEYTFDVAPSGNSPFQVGVSFQMTRGVDHLNESTSIDLAGLVP